MSSHHPLQHKLGVIRTLVHRAQSIITEEEDKVQELGNIRSALGHCGYRRSHFAVAKPIKDSVHGQKGGSPNKGHIMIPYVHGVSEGLTKRGVQVHFNPRNTLCELLVAPKDKIKKEDQCGVIYKLSCVDCHATYVRETGRSLGARMSGHRGEGSPIAEHGGRGRGVPSGWARIVDGTLPGSLGGREAACIGIH